MTGYDKAKQQAEAIKGEKSQEVADGQVSMEKAKEDLEVVRQRMNEMYSQSANAGTDSIDASDTNMPTLRIIQPNKILEFKKILKGAEIGWFYRSDTNQQYETIDVNMIYVTKQVVENFKKTGQERQHLYYGVIAGTFEPFRLYTRGWSLEGSREFLTQVQRFKAKYRVPMFALTVTLKSVDHTGTVEDSGESYTIKKIVFDVKRDSIDPAGEMPMIEQDINRATALREMVDRFERMNQRSTPTPGQALPVTVSATTVQANPEDVPF
jgi:uncharacterized coiled-coil protein SlyX